MDGAKMHCQIWAAGANDPRRVNNHLLGPSEFRRGFPASLNVSRTGTYSTTPSRTSRFRADWIPCRDKRGANF
jgi:hypothetical protein